MVKLSLIVMHTFILLPILSLVLLVLLFNRKVLDWRRSILLGAIAWGYTLTAITESLSWFSLLSFSGLALSWSAINIALIGLYVLELKQHQVSSGLASTSDLIRNFKMPAICWVWLTGTIFIITTIGLIAIVAPPNTWDSMTYHMSRVAHWEQNHNVAHYPTYNLPQLFHPPFAEFAILHLQILSRSDRFANLVQWFCMVGSAIGVSLIAKQLRANLQGQVIASVFAVTIPMGILQASSTQNDYVVCFWIVCLAYFVIQSVQQKLNFSNSIAIGASLGLAILTKGSAYLLAFPFIAFLFLIKARQTGWKIWKPLLVISTLFLTLNFNHYLRNLDLFGSFLGTPADFAKEYKIEVISLPAFISNLVRNASLHADIVRSLNLEKLIVPLNGLVEKVIRILHSILGIDINDPRTTHPPGWYQVPGISFDENTASNPLHLVFILVSIALFLTYSRLRSQKSLTLYLLATTGGFALICLLLKLQPYQSRHHLSIFVLFSAFVGVVLSQALNRYLVSVLIVIMLIASTPWALENKYRPIAAEQNIFNMDRIEQYFINREQLQVPYEEAVNFVKAQQCQNVGLWLGTNDSVGNRYWEYPFWVLFNSTNTRSTRLEHVKVQNISAEKSNLLPYSQFVPCAVVFVQPKDEAVEIKQTDIQGYTYTPTWSNDTMVVLEQEKS
ncbi:glycosyltransferase family 39 protein [Oculatella sp. FACHB-28]|uniref:ArnT family glycosyltransferase n=1 Tax=Oculatella sp. FACHB-28 TaxID=2692845 RepID=UPI00168542B5|nr:glycosyltransferase family 39 protein [Oculatella sp. FACHB-28]